MKNLERLSYGLKVLGRTFRFPRSYYRRLHKVMEDFVYRTLGLWRGYSFFSFDRFTLAVSLVILASALELVLWLELGSRPTYFIYFVAVFSAAWLGGSRTALITLFLSVLSMAVLFKSTILSIVSTSAEIFELGTFFAVSLFVIFFITSLAQARRYHDFITERLKYKEQYLMGVNKSVSDLLESVDDGFLACDKSLSITFANSSILKTLKKKQVEVIGQKIDKVFSEQFLNIFNIHYTKQKHENTGESVFRFDWELEERLLSVRVYLKDTLVSFYFSDVTFYKDRDQKKDFFVRAAGHELKTPITSMKLFLEIIQSSYRDVIPEEVGNYIGKVQGQLNKMVILINSLLDLSRIEGGSGITVDCKNVDMATLIQEAVEMFRFISSNHRIEVETAATEEVFLDKEKIMQVIVNLISNAIKYSPAGGVVKVKVRSFEGMVEVSVQDFGIGIDSQYHDKIFKKFFRVNEEHRQVYPGLGVGLYISYSIIRGHNGRMWVESESGKGSIFYFTIPLTNRQQVTKLF